MACTDIPLFSLGKDMNNLYIVYIEGNPKSEAWGSFAGERGGVRGCAVFAPRWAWWVCSGTHAWVRLGMHAWVSKQTHAWVWSKTHGWVSLLSLYPLK